MKAGWNAGCQLLMGACIIGGATGYEYSLKVCVYLQGNAAHRLFISALGAKAQVCIQKLWKMAEKLKRGPLCLQLYKCL